MTFFRRLLGLPDPDDDREAMGPITIKVVEEPRAPVPEPEPELPTGLPCPYCGTLIDPPPERNRRCPSCRESIVVRHVEGRLALLTTAAVAIFETERQREVDILAWEEARLGWLRLARRINAPPARRARLEASPISEAIVSRSRDLYLATAERAVTAARREHRWGDVGRIRCEQARALFDEAGQPVPLPEPIDHLYREGMVAVLRSLEPLAREVELVSSGCCRACRADDGNAFRITAEIRQARLPHADCPTGLCHCDWWPATAEPPRRRRRRSVKPAASPQD